MPKSSTNRARALLLSVLVAAALASPVAAQDKATPAIVLRDAGFVLPAGMLYDAQNDRYLVSNIGAGNDNDGFISIVSPDGKLVQLKWIEGGANGVDLADPKGMAARDDVLYVADLKAVRRFDLATGKQLASIPIEGAVALDDLAIAGDGTLFVTDGGVRKSSNGGIYRIGPDGKVEVLERGEQTFNPHGIAIASDGAVVNVTQSADYVVARGPDGGIFGTLTLDKGALDGLLLLPDGTMLVTSWGSKDITAIGLDGKQTELFGNIDTPSYPGFDTRRNRLLVPQMLENAVRILALPGKP